MSGVSGSNPEHIGKGKDRDMHHLKQPRGKGYVFAMETPRDLWDARVFLNSAEAWAGEITKDEGRGPHEVSARDALDETVSAIRSRPKSKRPPEAAVRKFTRVATRTGYSLEAALHRYLDERGPGNRTGNKPLGQTTANDVTMAMRYLVRFMDDEACLQDVDRRTVRVFRQDHLPSIRTPRAPEGMAPKTINKHVTLLAGLWDWAI